MTCPVLRCPITLTKSHIKPASGNKLMVSWYEILLTSKQNQKCGHSLSRWHVSINWPQKTRSSKTTFISYETDWQTNELWNKPSQQPECCNSHKSISGNWPNNWPIAAVSRARRVCIVIINLIGQLLAPVEGSSHKQVNLGHEYSLH